MTGFSSQHHSFDIHLAAKYGMTEAIIIHHLQHWIGINQRKPNGNKTSFRDGKWWTYQTIDHIAAHFPYLSRDQVVTAIERLCNGKTRFEKEKKFEPVLVKGNFNKLKYDHTSWYSFVNEEKFTFLCSHKKGFVDPQNGDCGNTKPIPDTKTDAKENKQPETPVSALAPPPSSVVRSFRDDLLNRTEITAPQAMKIKTQFAHLDDDTFKEAIETFIAYSTENAVGNYIATLITALGGGKNSDPWVRKDSVDDREEENKKLALAFLGKYDLKSIGNPANFNVSLCNKYIDFSFSSTTYSFKYSRVDFVIAVNKFLEKSGSIIRILKQG